MKIALVLISLFLFSCTNADNNKPANVNKDSVKKAYDSAGKEIIRKTP